MYNTTQLVHYDPSAPLFCQFFKSVLDCHVFRVESALLVLKEFGVQRHQFAKCIALDLINETIDGVAVHEASLLRVMGVQVKVEG